MDSDAQIVERVIAGNRDAFAELVVRYERTARATALRVVSDSHVIDDVIQDAFIAAYKSLYKLRVASKFGPWLLGIVRRQAVRSLRRKRETVLLNDSASEIAFVDTSGILPEDSMALLELLDRLSDDERTLIGLRHFEAHSMSEIAGITSRPVGTVTKQMSRIHKKLRQWITEEKS